jgi:hypothetical protein
MDEKIITLRKPVDLGGVEYATLQLREPTAGELEKASRADSAVGTCINLISAVATMPRAAVEKIGQRDFNEACDFFSSFGDGLGIVLPTPSLT